MKPQMTTGEPRMRTPQRQMGFTLLEILIALIILSIGLLGLAGLQANSLKNNNSAYQRTQASLLANEMLDRIRANRQGLEAGAYDAIDSTATSDPGCITSGCSSAQLAQYDADDARTGATGTACSGDTSVDLTCFTLSTRP